MAWNFLGHDIIDLVQHLQLQRVVLLGHSLGGMIVPWRKKIQQSQQSNMPWYHVRMSMMGDGHLMTSIYFPTYAYNHDFCIRTVGLTLLAQTNPWCRCFNISRDLTNGNNGMHIMTNQIN